MEGQDEKTPALPRANFAWFAYGLIGFGALAFASVALTKGGGYFAAVWVPNALSLAILLRWRAVRQFPFLVGVFAGSSLGNFASGFALVQSIGFSLANVAEIALAAFLIRRYCGRFLDVSRTSDLARFLLFAGGIAPLVSTTISFATLQIGQQTAWSAAIGWWTSDALGLVLITPLALILIDTWRGMLRPPTRAPLEWIALVVASTIANVLVFAQASYPFLFLVAPVVLIFAFRLGALGTAFAMMQVGLIATLFTIKGVGPISLVDGGLGEKLMVLQVFLACIFIIGLPVAAALDDKSRMLEELANKQAQLKLLTENVTDAVLCYDATGKCIYASPSVEAVLGRSVEDLLGARAGEQTRLDAAERIAEAERRLLAGEIDKDRFTYRRAKDNAAGEAVYIEADCALVRGEDGQPHGIIVSARDVTQRVSLERQLVRAKRHAENAAAAKSQFLANMSHEIRTPMNGVLGFAELLLQSDLSKEQAHHARLIAESGEVMMRLLNDILDISKIEAGQMAVIEEPVNVRHLLDGCLTLHSANAQRKGVALSLEVDDSVPGTIASDPLRLRQIVLNLVGNAVKFTHVGTVRIRACASEDNLEIAVEDSGVGIPAVRLEAIFNPFEQAEGATSRRFGGSGLGLTISRQLAILLGGSLQAESAIGEGSRFCLRLPLSAVEQQAIPVEGGIAADCPMLPPARILLAEDHDINRMLVTAMLERCGQQVECAEDGDEAIAKVAEAASGGRGFDLVLMDVQMPHCDGYEATRRIRKRGFDAKTLPIIALTANAYEEDVRNALECGMQAHLAKPLIFAELARTLRRWLPQAKQEAGTSTQRHAHTGSSELDRKWQERRQEALEAVAALVREGGVVDTDLEQVGTLMHKLAGTAAMFGEAELGDAARTLEDTIRAQADAKALREKAHRVLDAA